MYFCGGWGERNSAVFQTLQKKCWRSIPAACQDTTEINVSVIITKQNGSSMEGELNCRHL